PAEPRGRAHARRAALPGVPRTHCGCGPARPALRGGPVPRPARLAHNRGMQTGPDILLRPARREDVPAILRLIRALADYERLAREVEADEARLEATLFGERPCAEVVIAQADGAIAGFALFFHTYSTFL